MAIDLKEIKNKFDLLTKQEQWDWLVTTDMKDQFTLYMDNDDTHIYFHNDEQADYCLRFKGYIGTSAGAYCLMKSIGINAQNV